MVRRLRFRFSVRFLFCIMLVTSIACVWFLKVYLDVYRKDAVLLGRLNIPNGTIYESARQPEWLWKLIDEQVSERGDTLLLSDTEADDEDLATISQLSELGGLYLDRTNVTNRGLQSIKNMPSLVVLSMRRISISRAPPVAGMASLVEIDLAFTDVDYIDTTGLVSLEKLILRGTRVSDKTLSDIDKLENLKILDIAGAPGRPSKITDKGIAYLTKEKFPKLRTIYLYDIEVTDDAINRLRDSFPGLNVLR